MVPAAFPVAKLGMLLLKLINRPLTDAIKNYAKNSELFKSYVCTPPAHLYNWCETKTKIWILKMGQSVNVPALDEAVAIDLGANLIGEGIMFTTTASVVVTEYNKSVNKEAAKEKAKRDEIKELQNTVNELFMRKDELSAEIREVTRRINVIESNIK